VLVVSGSHATKDTSHATKDTVIKLIWAGPHDAEGYQLSGGLTYGTGFGGPDARPSLVVSGEQRWDPWSGRSAQTWRPHRGHQPAVMTASVGLIPPRISATSPCSGRCQVAEGVA
jgi:hypothetical protein